MLSATLLSVNDFQVFRRLQITENHLEIIKMFPANFRFILLQHSLDRYKWMNVRFITYSNYMVIQCRSRLFTAYFIPPQSQLSVTKKGLPLQQAGKCATLALIQYYIVLSIHMHNHQIVCVLLSCQPFSPIL